MSEEQDKALLEIARSRLVDIEREVAARENTLDSRPEWEIDAALDYHDNLLLEQAMIVREIARLEAVQGIDSPP